MHCNSLRLVSLIRVRVSYRVSSRVRVRIRVKVRVSVVVRVSIRTSWVVNLALFRCYRPVIYSRPVVVPVVLHSPLHKSSLHMQTVTPWSVPHPSLAVVTQQARDTTSAHIHNGRWPLRRVMWPLHLTGEKFQISISPCFISRKQANLPTMKPSCRITVVLTLL